MEQSVETFRKETYFQNNLHLFVNRSVEAFVLPLHSHEFIEFAYVAEGKGFHYIENEVQRIHRGQLHFIPMGVSHVFRPTSADTTKDPLIVYNCIFTPQLIEGLIPYITDQPILTFLEEIREGKLPYYSVIDCDAEIERLFLSLYREYSLTQSGSLTYLNALLLQLMVTIYRLKHDMNLKQLSKPSQFLQVLKYLEQKYAEELTLSHVADMFQWSDRHFQRLFKQYTGQTFLHYLQNLRIQKSCELLRSSQLSIGRIAESVGYKDMNSFLALFKKIVGVTPSGYRSRYASTN